MESATSTTIAAKPLLRGWIHAITFPLAIVLGVLLVVLAHGATAKWGAAVFMVCSSLLFGLSALYHRFKWSATANAVLRRIDHANIFLMIAGTYTPIILCVIHGSERDVALALIWGGALLGILFHIFWLSAPRWLYVGLYLALGWAAVATIGDLVRANLVAALLVMIGGLIYTAGAVVYAMKRPNPKPGVFGFHEVFHTATVLAYFCHWIAVLIYTTAART